MKNTLADLNNYLFEAIENLQDADLDDEQLDKEIRRAGAVRSVSETIIKNASLALKAAEFSSRYQEETGEQPALMPGIFASDGD